MGSQVMSKLTVALLAALICILLADVSGEQQSLETDTLSEVLSDHTLVKREADPGRKEPKRSVQRVKRERNVEGQGKGQEERVKQKVEMGGREERVKGKKEMGSR